MDLYSRKIIAWTLSNTLEVSCVIETINKAKARRKIEEPLIMHSDRGMQYVSGEYKRVTANMQCSYSKKAYPWDNACIESFHSLIKREWLNRFKIRDYEHAYHLVFEYLEAFYNTEPIHRGRNGRECHRGHFCCAKAGVSRRKSVMPLRLLSNHQGLSILSIPIILLAS